MEQAPRTSRDRQLELQKQAEKRNQMARSQNSAMVSAAASLASKKAPNSTPKPSILHIRRPPARPAKPPPKPSTASLKPAPEFHGHPAGRPPAHFETPRRISRAASTDSDTSFGSVTTLTADSNSTHRTIVVKHPNPALAGAAKAAAATRRSIVGSPATPSSSSQGRSQQASPAVTAASASAALTLHDQKHPEMVACDPVVAASAAASSEASRPDGKRLSLTSNRASLQLGAAAARASSLNPVKVEPRPGLSDRLLDAFTSEKDTEAEDSKKAVEAAAARLSAQKSPPRIDTPQSTGDGAKAAAMLARNNVDSEVARIDSSVTARRERKQRFKPAASWSEPVQQRQHHHHHLIPTPLKHRRSFNTDRSVTDGSDSDARFLPSPSPSLQVIKQNNRHSGGHLKHMLAKVGLAKEEIERPNNPDGPSMRKVPKKHQFNEHKPWKHHEHAATISDKERKRYERVWAANKGSHIKYFVHPPMHDGYMPGSPTFHYQIPTSGQSVLSFQNPPSIREEAENESSSAPVLTVSDQPAETPDGNDIASSNSPMLNVDNQSVETGSIRSVRTTTPSIKSSASEPYDPQVEDVHGYVIANLWRRSKLPDDTLAKIWSLVDHNHDGTLDRESFIVGTWLVDQCLYGRKLPAQISDDVWSSAGRLNVKIRMKDVKKKLGRRHKSASRKAQVANAAALVAHRDQPLRPTTPQSSV